MSLTPTQQIKEIIEEILAHMTIQGQVAFEESQTRGAVFNISSNEGYLLIGRQGINLQALQLVVQVLAVKRLGFGAFPRFIIDVDDYRQKREHFLKEMARGAAEKVIKTGVAVTFDPMPNYERRYIHSYIQEHFSGLVTESVGTDSSRRIMLRKI